MHARCAAGPEVRYDGAPASCEGGSGVANSGVLPLQVPGDISGSARGGLFDALATFEQHSPLLPDAQQSPASLAASCTGSASRVAQHDIVARSARVPSARSSATPNVRPATMRSTHASQVALPGRMSLAAAIQRARAMLGAPGGSTPCSSAQTRRWCGVLQQQLFQHSRALPQPHMLCSQGYRSLEPRPSQVAILVGVGSTPIDATANESISTMLTNRLVRRCGRRRSTVGET